MFLLEERNGLIGSNIIDLIDPAFVQVISVDGVRSVFKLAPLGNLLHNCQSNPLFNNNILVAVRSDGSTFEMRVVVTNYSPEGFTASLNDLHQVDLENSFSQFIQASYSPPDGDTSVSPVVRGGMVVYMNEWDLEEAEWVDTGRYVEGKSEVDGSVFWDGISLDISFNRDD